MMKTLKQGKIHGPFIRPGYPRTYHPMGDDLYSFPVKDSDGVLVGSEIGYRVIYPGKPKLNHAVFWDSEHRVFGLDCNEEAPTIYGVMNAWADGELTTEDTISHLSTIIFG